MLKGMGYIIFETEPGKRLHMYDRLVARRTSSTGEAKEVAELHAKIIRGIILAHSLGLRPPFGFDQMVVSDDVSSPIGCPFEVTPWEIGRRVRVRETTYDEIHGWLIGFSSVSDFQLHKASDFIKEGILSKHFNPSALV